MVDSVHFLAYSRKCRELVCSRYARCSESTVKSHVAHLKDKLAVASRAELVKLYRLSCPA
jgi:hypothetical protein